MELEAAALIKWCDRTVHVYKQLWKEVTLSDPDVTMLTASNHSFVKYLNAVN